MKQLKSIVKITLIVSVAFEVWYMYALRTTPYKIARADRGLNLEELRGPYFRFIAGVAFFTIIFSTIIILAANKSTTTSINSNTPLANPEITSKKDSSTSFAKVILAIIALLAAYMAITILFGILTGHFWDGYQF